MRKRERVLALLGCGIVITLTTACAATSFESTAPRPGVPRISNLRIEPSEVENGADVTLRFDFRDMDGDIMDVLLGVGAEIKDFTFAVGLQPAVISRARYFGQAEGTVKETIKISIPPAPRPLAQRDFDGSVAEPEVPERAGGGIRVYEVFIVDGKGQASNRLRAQVTVRPAQQPSRRG